jgi:hypothetical protein
MVRPSEVIAGNLGMPTALEMDDSFFYIIDSGSTDPQAVTTRILRVPRAGGEAEVLASGLEQAYSLRLDDDSIYFCTRHAVNRLPKSGGPVEAVVSNPDMVFLELAVDEQAIYYVEALLQVVARQDKVTGESSALHIGGTDLHGLALWEDELYYADVGTIYATPRAGGERRIVIDTPLSVPFPNEIVVDADGVWWSAGEYASADRMALGGLPAGATAPLLLLTGVTDVRALVTTGNYVFAAVYGVQSEGPPPYSAVRADKTGATHGGLVETTGSLGAFDRTVDEDAIYTVEPYTSSLLRTPRR